MMLKKQLAQEEGNVPYAYQDHLGYWTIGIGFLIDKRKGGGLRPEEIEFIFDNRIRLLKEELNKKIPWISSLNEPRQAVLISMAYQMGVDGLLGFKNTLNTIKLGDYSKGAKEMLLSKWARTDTPARAKRMSLQMQTGLWQ